jgi:hypothetical protein
VVNPKKMKTLSSNWLLPIFVCLLATACSKQDIDSITGTYLEDGGIVFDITGTLHGFSINYS